MAPLPPSTKRGGTAAAAPVTTPTTVPAATEASAAAAAAGAAPPAPPTGANTGGAGETTKRQGAPPLSSPSPLRWREDGAVVVAGLDAGSLPTSPGHPPRHARRRSAVSPMAAGSPHRYFAPLPGEAAFDGDSGGGGGGGRRNPDRALERTLSRVASRVSSRAGDMLAERLEVMKQAAAAHGPVEEEDEEGDLAEVEEEEEEEEARPWPSALRNLPVLLVMAVALAVVLACKSRLHPAEALGKVHGVTSADPYFMPLHLARVDYLYVLATAAPWYDPPPLEEAGAGAGAGGGGRGVGPERRRWGSEGASVRGAGPEAAARAALGAEADAAGEALRRAWERVGWDRGAADGDGEWRSAALAAVRAGKRVRELDRRGVGGRRGRVAALRRAIEAGQQQVRQLGPWQSPAAASPLAASRRRRRRRDLLASAADPAPAAPPPRLILQLVEKVVTEGAPAAAELSAAVLGAPPSTNGYALIGDPQYCQLKEAAAAKCAFAFVDTAPTAASKPGSPLYLSMSLDREGATAVEIDAHELGWLGRAKNWIALAILVAMLLAIASEKVHRMWCAVVASFCMLGLLLWIDMAPGLPEVMTWLDVSTLGLLFGMMLIVGKTAQTGAFEVMTAGTLRLAGGSMALLTVLLLTVTAVVSAFLDNVTTILLMGPITISLLKTMNADPRPLLVAQVLASNIGGAASLVGDPPNIIIGTALSHYIGFVDFLVHMGPGVLLTFVACVPVILLLNKKSLLGRIPDYDNVLAAAGDYRITDWGLFWKCTFVLGVVVIGFLLHPIHHLDPAWFAIIGATVLCISSDRLDVEELMHLVEWDMLVFFAALFCMVEGAVEVGLIDMIGSFLAGIIRAAPPEARRIVAIEILLWMSAIISALLDNVPFTLTMVPVIEYLAASNMGLPLPLLAWALAFGACYGGNGTLVGASANIVGASILDRSGYPMSFLTWLRCGVPVMGLSVGVANAYMLLRYCLPGSTEYPPSPIVAGE